MIDSTAPTAPSDADNEADPRDQTETADDQGDQTDNPALLAKLKAWHRESTDHLSDWRIDAKEDFAFAAGDQWSEEDRSLLKEQMRPVITYNRTGPVLDSVAGLEVGNRQETHYFPREVGDSGPNELLNSAAKFFREESDVEDEESDAFQDVLICGLGCTETRPDYETDPEGLLPTERIDPLGVFYDPSARKRNLADRRFCGYEKEMPLEEAESLFPDAVREDLHASWATVTSDKGDKPHNAQEAPFYENDQSGRATSAARRKVVVVYFEWWDRQRYFIVADQATGQKVEFDEKRWQATLDGFAQAGMPPPQAAAMTRKVYKHAFVGAKVLKAGPGRCKTDFTVNFITGKRNRNENTWYGLVRGMKDPQRWANKFFSQILHIINSNAKGGAFVERSALENPKEAEDKWANPGSLIILKDGALSKGQIQARPAITYPVGLDRMMEFSVSSIRDVTGVSLELLGMADRDQPGILEAQRKQAGMTILATLFDSLRRYRKVHGRVLLYLIQHYVTPGRLIRIDGENGIRYAPLALDPSKTKYDVIVDDAPMSVNQKDTVWAMMVQMMPLLQRAPLPAEVWAQLLKYSPLPETLSTKIGQGLVQQEQGAQQKPDPAMAKVEAQAKGQQAKMMIDAQSAQASAQLDQQVAAANYQLESAKADAQMRLEGLKAANEWALQQQQARHEAELAAYKAQAEMQISLATVRAQSAARPGGNA